MYMFIHTGAPCEIPEIVAKTTSKGRTYTTANGDVYPSITTILGHKEKPHLVAWQQSLGMDKANKEKKRCADRGTAVHEMAEDFLNNVKNPTKGRAADHVRGFNQLKFKLRNIDNIRMQEAGLYSDRLGVAGRVDVVGEYDGVLSVIDFKTSNNNKDKEMIEDYFLQATFYAIAWHELTGEAITDIAILMSVEKGMVPLIFRDTIDKYVEPLLVRIDEYYRKCK